jgi:hypothetical protein
MREVKFGYTSIISQDVRLSMAFWAYCVKTGCLAAADGEQDPCPWGPLLQPSGPSAVQVPHPVVGIQVFFEVPGVEQAFELVGFKGKVKKQALFELPRVMPR